MSPQNPDPERLEEGLRRLRQLGYLQGPAERYVARRVPTDASLARVAGATGFWVGAVGGAAFGLLLSVSAVLADPALLDRPHDLGWLTLDLVLLMASLGLVGTLLFTAGVLAWFRGRGRSHPPTVEKLALLLPGMVASIYLTDRLARHALPELPASAWVWGASTVVLVAGGLAALATLALVAMVATARMQWRGVWRPEPLARWERTIPFLLAAGVSGLLLVLGPYAALRPLPFLDEIKLSTPQGPVGTVTLIAVDGIDGMPWLDVDPRALDLDVDDRGSHPAAFWNELATGFRAKEHGLTDASTEGPRGLVQGLGELRGDPVLDTVLRHVLPGVGLGVTRAADQRELRRPPFWEVAAHAGLRARVVNWWATYPAARHERLEVLSDRAVFRSLDGDTSDPNLAQPAALADLLAALLTARRQAPADAPAPEFRQGIAWIEAEAPDEPDLLRAWRLAIEADRTHLDLAFAPLGPELPAVRAVLLNGADILARALRRSEAAASAAGGGPLRDLHRRLLERWLRARAVGEEGEMFWVAATTVAGGSERRAWAARSGPSPVPTQLLQWAPVLLWECGVVPAGDMLRPPEIPPIVDGPGTFGRRPRWTPEADRSSEDLERLRSLGYIGG